MSAADAKPIEDVWVTEREEWLEGPVRAVQAHAQRVPVHWTEKISEYPASPATGRSPRRRHPHGQPRLETYSSEVGGITLLTDAIMPLELIQSMFIGMDPPSTIASRRSSSAASHEADRRARGRDPRDHP